CVSRKKLSKSATKGCALPPVFAGVPAVCMRRISRKTMCTAAAVPKSSDTAVVLVDNISVLAGCRCRCQRKDLCSSAAKHRPAQRQARVQGASTQHASLLAEHTLQLLRATTRAGPLSQLRAK